MKKYKGFTVVELVIVIAIIAVLAAVLIPTFSSLVKSANESADTQLIKNLNTSLRADLPDGKHPTMHDALKAAEAFGYDVDKINASAVGNEILWDQDNDVFCYAKGESVEYIPESVSADKKITSKDDYRLWKIYNAKSGAVPAAADQTNSIYLADNLVVSTPLNVKVGVDVGNRKDISSVTFENSTTTAQKVIIRMNGGNLTVKDTNDGSEQLFYGYAENVEVTTGSTCFVAHGVIGNMDLKAGKAIADSGAFIGLIKAASGTIAIERNGGMFIIPASNQIDPNVDLSGVDQSEGKNEKAIEAFAKSIAEEDDGTVAIIGTKKYASFKMAVETAKTGEKIYLINDFSIEEDIGELSQNANEGWIGGLRNEVVLYNDITITFIGAKQLHFHDSSAIRMNGHTLKLVASTDGAGLFLVKIDEELERAMAESGATLTLNSDIECIQTATMDNFVEYSSGKWIKSSQIAGGGSDPVEGPGTPPSFPSVP